MGTTPQILHEYVTRTGKNPFRKWLLSLRDIHARAKIRVRLNRIRSGNFGDVKSIGDGVSELKINHGPGYRVYFAKKGNAIVLLLCGGDKPSQTKDIKTAKEHWADYNKRLS
jgi:putative addiction module killer protein